VFLGPIVGAAALYTLEIVIGQYTQYWQIVLGLILLAIVLLAPEGLSGVILDIRKRFSRSTGHDA
jgi:branched-chain amino acid transport system permease protein